MMKNDKISKLQILAGKLFDVILISLDYDRTISAAASDTSFGAIRNVGYKNRFLECF